MSRNYKSSIFKENVDGSKREGRLEEQPNPIDIPKELQIVRLFIIINLIFIFAGASNSVQLFIFIGRVTTLFLIFNGITKKYFYTIYLPVLIIVLNTLSFLHSIYVLRIDVSMNFYFITVLLNKLGAAIFISLLILKNREFFDKYLYKTDKDNLYPPKPHDTMEKI